MRMDEVFNFIVPIPRQGSPTIYAHAAPLSAEVFEAHWLVISKTFTALNVEGLSIVGAPRVAALALKNVATGMGVWAGPEGVEKTLVAEIARLTNVLLPADGGGWTTLPLMVAVERGLLSARERMEVMGAIVFFMLNSAMHRPDILMPLLGNLADLWGTRTTSFTCTEFAASLPTWIVDATSGGTAAT